MASSTKQHSPHAAQGDTRHTALSSTAHMQRKAIRATQR
jgi:hypothetical protein